MAGNDGLIGASVASVGRERGSSDEVVGGRSPGGGAHPKYVKDDNRDDTADDRRTNCLLNLQRMLKNDKRGPLIFVGGGRKKEKGRRLGKKSSEHSDADGDGEHVNVSFLYFLLHLTLHGRNSPPV